MLGSQAHHPNLIIVTKADNNMKRREFAKIIGSVAATPFMFEHNSILATEVSLAPSENHFDFFSDIPKLNIDLASRYFRPNLNESIEYDAIVIGSGMGGGILADAISDAGLKTLVLEAGSLRHFVHISNLPIGNSLEVLAPYKIVDNSSSYGALSFCLGGKSLFWANVIPRMEKWELQYWPNVIADYLLVNGYEKAENVFRKRTQYLDGQIELKNYFAETFNDFTVSHLPRAYHTPTPTSRKGFPDERSTGSFSTSALLTASVVSSGTAGFDNLTINLNHIATHIETKNNRAIAVHCYDPTANKTRRFSGRSIVLCAGTMESARIALSSKLKDKSKKIGVGPTLHQSAEMQFIVPDTFKLLSRFDQANLYLRPKDNESRDRYTCELALNWQFWDAKTEDDDVWNQKYGQPKPSKSTIKFLFRHPLDDRNYIRINGRSCNVFINPLDGEPLKNEVFALKNRVMQHFGVSNNDLSGAINYSQGGDAIWHIAGSLRIGEPGVGVIDSDLKFHEYENLYSCDLSIFPDIPSVNPSLTLCALALRLANKISV